MRQVRTGIVWLSLLLSVATIGMGGRSFGRRDMLEHGTLANNDHTRVGWGAASSSGRISIFRSRIRAVPVTARLKQQYLIRGWSVDSTVTNGLTWSLCPFETRYNQHPATGNDVVGRYDAIEFPHWALLLVVSFPAQISAFRWIKARRRRKQVGFPMQVGESAECQH